MTLLDVRIAPSAWNARTVREHLIRIASTIEMNPKSLEDFVTAIGEAFANAVEHAHTTTPIEIVVKSGRNGQLTASVRDRGCGIDERAIRQALPPAGAERGRGIPLMRRCSSSVRISAPRDGGTLVALSWG